VTTINRVAVPRITKEELKDRLGAGTDTRPVVIVRVEDPSQRTDPLSGAVRVTPGRVDTARPSRNHDTNCGPQRAWPAPASPASSDSSKA